jgi:Xaa-Pro aminopeptidase
MTSSSQDLLRFIEAHQRDLFGDPYRERAFDGAEYAARHRRFRAAMSEAGVDAAIVTAPDTMAWLHGFRSRWYRQHTSTRFPPAQCCVISTDSEALFMIEASYHDDLVRATSVVADIRCPPGGIADEMTLDEYVSFLLDQLASISARPMTVGLELWSCVPSPAVSRRVEAALAAADHHVVDVTLPIRALRHVKSPAEIDAMEQAQAACDAGLLAIQRQVKPGMTELQAWAIFAAAAVDAGGEPAALHETVGIGATMPNLHRISSRARIRPGQVFHADAASSYYGYHARATRPYYVGTPPSQLLELVSIAAGAHEVLQRFGKVGTPWQEVMTALDDYYRGTGIEGGAAGYEMGVTVPPADWVNEFVYSSVDTGLPGVIEENSVTNFETWNVIAIVDLVVFESTGPRVVSGIPRELLTIEA